LFYTYPMNKHNNQKGFAPIQIVLSILAGTIVLGGIVGGVLYYSKSPQELSQGKCGDGVCDIKEKANPNLCPRDCVSSTVSSSSSSISSSISSSRPSSASPKSSSEKSPFGFHPGNAENYSYIKDLGAKWSREGLYLRWGWVDVNRDGSYKFTEATTPAKPNVSNSGGKINYDNEWLNAPKDTKLVLNVCPFGRGGDFKDSEESAIYQNFVEKTVERYDGDNDLGCVLSSPDCYKNGDRQYPTSEVIQVFKNNPIKYWQVCNQVYDASEEDKTNYASQFALVQEKTYKGVKAADGSAAVLIAGDSNKELYPKVFKELNGKYIDIIDFHHFGQLDWYNPKKDFDYIKTSLQSSGFDISKLRFWITETGTYSGDPVALGGKPDLPYQTEKQQADGVIKAYVSAISYGIEKVFWAWNIVEGFQRSGSIFDYTGLVYDGCDYVNNKYQCGSNIGYDKGKGVKKLSYYTYKKMVEILEGSDWDNIEAIQEKDGVYVYKFTKDGKPIWVAWNDNNGEKQVVISGVNSSSVKITESVPNYGSGKEVKDYATAFKTETRQVTDNKLTITLNESPVFVEEM